MEYVIECRNGAHRVFQAGDVRAFQQCSDGTLKITTKVTWVFNSRYYTRWYLRESQFS